jgi:acyl carrier protein
LLREKLLLFNIAESEVKDAFDLVKSGLLDSMAFVDLIAEAEENYQIEIDFEVLADTPDFTSLGKVVNIILNADHA